MPIKHPYINNFLSGLLLAVGLVACGGGGGGSDEETIRLTANATAGVNGSISPASIMVASGEIINFTITPDAGYEVDSVSGCGGNLTGNNYTSEMLSTSCTVTVSFTKLPLFTTLTDGGSTTGIDNLVVKAPEGSIDEEVEIGMRVATTPVLPLPDDLEIKSKFYKLSANEDVSSNTSFVLAIPVPENTDGKHLALAYLSQAEDRILHESKAEPIWEIISGAYSAENNYFVTTLPFFAQDGRVVVLVASPRFSSGIMKGNPNRPNQQNRHAGDNTPGFKVSCKDFDNTSVNNRNISCSSTDEADLERTLEDTYTDLEPLGFAEPYLKREIDLEASSFTVNNANIVLGHYLAELRPYRDVVDDNASIWSCGVRPGGNTNLGGYSSGTQGFFVCMGSNGLNDTGRDTATHEYFHSIQFGYNAVRRASAQWVLEGTASTSESSLLEMQRNTGRPFHPVDKSLVDTSDLNQYKAQDFWVYNGQKLGRGLDYLQEIFNKGAKAATVDKAFKEDFPEIPDLATAYWGWVKNQAFEKEVDLGGSFGTNFCNFDGRMAAAVSIDYIGDAPPFDSIYDIPPLSSKVLKLNFFPMDNADYIGEINVLPANPDVKVKYYDVADISTTNCYDKDEVKNKSITVSKNTPRTLYALISNIGITSEAIVTLRFPRPEPSLEIISPVVNSNLEEGNTEFLAVAKGFGGGNPDLSYISWSYIDSEGVVRQFANSKSGEKVSFDLCDGTYNVTATTLYSGFNTTNISESVSFRVRNPDSGILGARCKWSIDIAEPTTDITYLAGDLINLKAIIDDDHPETDTPLAPITWREGDASGPILGTGLNSSTKFGAGQHTIYVEYSNNASKEVSITVIDAAGSPPDAGLNSPEADNNLRWQDYWDGSESVVIPFNGAGVDDEDGSIVDSSSLSWSYRRKGTSTWRSFGNGTNVSLDIRLVSPGQAIEVRLIVTDSDGLAGVKITEVYISGPAT